MIIVGSQVVLVTLLQLPDQVCDRNASSLDQYQVVHCTFVVEVLVISNN